MPNQPDIDLDALEELANAATAGDWVAPINSPDCVVVPAADRSKLPWTVASTQSAADARYIAALKPAVAKRLIADLRAMRAALTPQAAGAPTEEEVRAVEQALHLATADPHNFEVSDVALRLAEAGVRAPAN